MPKRSRDEMEAQNFSEDMFADFDENNDDTNLGPAEMNKKKYEKMPFFSFLTKEKVAYSRSHDEGAETDTLVARDISERSAFNAFGVKGGENIQKVKSYLNNFRIVNYL